MTLSAPALGRRSLLSLAVNWAQSPFTDLDAGAPLLRVRRRAMACEFEIVLDAARPAQAMPALAALDEVERVEALLSVYRSDSELSQLNAVLADPVRATGGVVVGDELWQFLVFCDAAFHACHGAFDPACGELVELWGFRPRRPRRPGADEIAAACARCGMGRVRLHYETQRVSARGWGVALNPGAVGKGWALDCAAELLRRSGVNNALLNAGGSSVVALGAGPDGDGWPVALPSAAGAPRVRRLLDAAMATSGGTEQYFEFEGRRYAHVVDPRSGMAVERDGLVSVVVDGRAARVWGGGAGRHATAGARPAVNDGTSVHDQRTAIDRPAAWADALSTAIFVAGRDETLRSRARSRGIEVLDSHDSANSAATE